MAVPTVGVARAQLVGLSERWREGLRNGLHYSLQREGDMVSESHLSLVRSNEPGDPIFDAIERHRRAHAIWSAAVHREITLEGKNDVRFIEPQLVTEEKAIERHNACVDLVTIHPTTIAGVIALLRYYAEHASLDGDTCWPEYSDDEGEHEHGEALVRHAVASLERISEATSRAAGSRVRL